MGGIIREMRSKIKSKIKIKKKIKSKRKRKIKRRSSAVFAIFGGEDGGEGLAEPGLGNGVVEDFHVVVPVAVAAAVGVAIQIGIAGEVVAGLIGIDVGFAGLVIARGAVVEEDYFGRGVAGARDTHVSLGVSAKAVEQGQHLLRRPVRRA